MNANKRKRIGAIIVLVEGIRDEEAQDLIDTPDNIENSGACDGFRETIEELTDAIASLYSASGLYDDAHD